MKKMIVFELLHEKPRILQNQCCCVIIIKKVRYYDFYHTNLEQIYNLYITNQNLMIYQRIVES